MFKRKPKLTAKIKVIGKRPFGDHRGYEFVSVEFQDGNRIEFIIGYKLSPALQIGDEGKIEYKLGRIYNTIYSFERIDISKKDFCEHCGTQFPDGKIICLACASTKKK